MIRPITIDGVSLYAVTNPGQPYQEFRRLLTALKVDDQQQRLTRKHTTGAEELTPRQVSA